MTNTPRDVSRILADLNDTLSRLPLHIEIAYAHIRTITGDGYPTTTDGRTAGISNPTMNAALTPGREIHANITDALMNARSDLRHVNQLLAQHMALAPTDARAQYLLHRCKGYGKRDATCEQVSVRAGYCWACYQAKRRDEDAA